MEKTIQNRLVKEMNEAQKIARFYGFQPIESPKIEKNDIESVKNLDKNFIPSEKSAFLRIYFEEKMMLQAQPCMFYCERPFPGSNTGERKKPMHLDSCLVTLGSSKSICECISIQSAISILKSLGYKNLEVEINSIGDKDSVSEFQKKLNLFIRKNYAEFPNDLKQAVKKDPLAILKEDKNEWKNFKSEAPKFIDFLSESSRLHFKEVLEFLEILNITYEMNYELCGDLEYGSETVFAIRSGQERLAFGFRFNRLAKKIGHKKEVPCTILNFSCKLRKKLTKVKPKAIKPQFYLIQFGPEAKLKSFLIMEEIFKSGSSVIHSIAKDKLGSQIGIAENSEAPYILLIGQKEALENSVVIRNTATRAQELVPISELGNKIKELK